MLKKVYRLRKRRDFRRTYQKGKILKTRYFVLYWRPNGLKNYRIGFSVSKKLGSAVIRNRVKRQLREICRRKAADFVPGFDYIFIARFGIKEISPALLELEVAKAAAKPGLKTEVEK